MTERRNPISKPAEEHTADQSTQSASGLSEARPGPGPDLTRPERDDVVARERTGDEEPPRRYDEDVEENPTLPDDADPTLRTTI